jgi:hypothetical protein
MNTIQNLIIRNQIIDKCEKDLEFRQLCLEMCKRDKLWWCDNFVTAFNPRESPPFSPFILYPRQRELLNWVDAMKRDRVEGQVRWACVPKSRDIGATWVLGAINQVHSWLFTDYYVGWVGANVISTVDEKGSSKSIMEKYRMLLNRLPKWMQPEGWDSRENNKTGFIKNPINGSEIAGIGGDSFGRGGRATEVIIDEWNHCERPDAKISALSAVADNVFFVSTVYGTAHKFYEQVTSGDYPVFSYHWKDHPIKGRWFAPKREKIVWDQEMIDGYERAINNQDEWDAGWGWDSPLGAVYPFEIAKRREVGDLIWAQEYDMDFTSSVQGVVIPPEYVMACVNSHLRIDGLAEASSTKAAGLDVSVSKKGDQTVFCHRVGCVVQPLIRWRGLKPTPTVFKSDELMREFELEKIAFDSDGVGEGCAHPFENIENRPYNVTAFHGNGTPSDDVVWEGEGKTSKEKFRNCRAEGLYLIRERAKKTYEVIHGIKNHPLDELLSIPNDGSLINQMSQPITKYTTTGKILIESKDDMKKRGLSSPDDLDALVLSFVEGYDPSWVIDFYG